MSGNRQYTDEFKSEAVKQVVGRGLTVVDVATRIGVLKHTLHGWVQSRPKAAQTGIGVAPVAFNDSAEVRRLKSEVKRVNKERDILKSRRVHCQGVKAKCAFMRAHAGEFWLAAMCRVLDMHRSGYYTCRA